MKTQEQLKIEGLENKHNALVLLHDTLRRKAGNLGWLAILSLLFNGFFIIALGRPYIGGAVLIASLFLLPYVNSITPKIFYTTRHIVRNPGLKDPTQCYCTNSKCAKCLNAGCTRQNCIVHLDIDKIKYQTPKHH